MSERKGKTDPPPGGNGGTSANEVSWELEPDDDEPPKAGAPAPPRSDSGSRRPPPPLPPKKRPGASIPTPVGIGPSRLDPQPSARTPAKKSVPPPFPASTPAPKRSAPSPAVTVSMGTPKAPGKTATPAVGSPANPAQFAAAAALGAPPARSVPPLSAVRRAPLPPHPPGRATGADKPAPKPPPKAVGKPRPPAPEVPPPRSELRLRADRQKGRDPLAAARSFVELGIYEERIGKDRKAGRKCYESARALAKGIQPALTRLRRSFEGKAELPQALDIVGEELVIAEDDALKADLLADRARMCEALGKSAEARKAFGEALALAPRHPASLRGLEALLQRELARALGAGGAASRASTPDANRAAAPAGLLAAHLERLSAAFAPSAETRGAEPRLAAWLEVERARLHDDVLGQHDLARAALIRATTLDPASGAVRDALTRHLVVRGATEGLVQSLVIEAEGETDHDRASRLLYTAARMLIDKLDQPAAAVALLQKAVARAPAQSPTRRRALGCLAPLLEGGGDLLAAADTRQKHVAELREPEAIAHEHVALSDLFSALGRADWAAEHARRALDVDPEDLATQERLDRALSELGRDQERIAAWVAQGNARRPVAVRVAAFVRAAEIAEHKLQRREDAIAHLRAAWVIDPGNGEVFDALSALVAPPARDPEAETRGARDRIELYTQAAHAARAPSRKVGLLEKVAHIWEDELALPERALEPIERILEIEPTRQSAILALQRTAGRSGDARRLARGLVAEANLTTDRSLSRRLLLRAAEVISERLSDRDQALVLVDQALAADPNDPDSLRARFNVLDRAGRHEEAKKALVALAARDPQGAFTTWIEIARLDEHKLKKPHEAVRAYQEAARVKPRHPLPKLEIARLLRQVGDWAKLCEALNALVESAVDPVDGARLLFELAEVQELRLRDDAAALKSLERADSLLGKGAEDPALLEAMERIHVRRAAAPALAALYQRWLERRPPAPLAHRLRLALATVVAETDKKQAAKVLEAVLAETPDDLPALRVIEHLHRALGSHTALESVLRAEADALSSPLGKAFALWDIAAYEEQLGAEVVLGALERIATATPADTAAFDAMLRVGGKLAAAEGASPAAQARLANALAGRRQLALDPIARATYELEEAAIAEETAGEDAPRLRKALDMHSEALALWPDSILAARGVDRIARRLADAPAVVMAQLALAKVVDSPILRAEHLVRAAELTAQAGGNDAATRALMLYEEALFVDADNAAAATALTRLLANDTVRLVERLGDALERATVSEQMVLLGGAIGRAALRPSPAGSGPDAAAGVAAMRRVLAEAPDDIASLRTMASLLSTLALWREAEEVLTHIVEVGPDRETALAVHFELARIYEGPLGELAAAEASLEKALALDPKNHSALEQLHRIALARGEGGRAALVLDRLIEGEKDVTKRLGYEMQLAAAMREGGDRAGAVRALCSAIVSAPSDARPWTELAALQPTDTPDGALAYAKSLQHLLEIAASRRVTAEPRWLTTLGLLEITSLRKSTDGIGHLQKAAALPGATSETHVALGRGLEAVGRNAEAVKVLREALASDAGGFARADLTTSLGALESALTKEGRAAERAAVEEVRALIGDAYRERLKAFRARLLPDDAPYASSLAGGELAALIVPEARSPMVDVALAIAPVAAKALRFELGKLGVTSRDRIGPRDGHPTRVLADRVARALGVEAFELYLTSSWQGAARVYPGDPPAIVGPSSFGELPDCEQAFALGRLLTRTALGFTWIDELSIEAADGLLLASVRAVEPSFEDGVLSADRERFVENLLPYVQRAIGRRQRKLLESIAPTVTSGYDPRLFSIGVRRTEYRTAYVLCGNLVAAVDYLRRFDPELGRSADAPRVLLDHPVSNELLRFALTADAYTERRRVGTV